MGEGCWEQRFSIQRWYIDSSTDPINARVSKLRLVAKVARWKKKKNNNR